MANLRLATYGGSTTTGNMPRNGKATLILIDERVAYHVKGRASEMAAAMKCAAEYAKLNVHVEHVLADLPDPRFEPNAYIAPGITFQDPHRSEQLARARRMVAELLQ